MEDGTGTAEAAIIDNISRKAVSGTRHYYTLANEVMAQLYSCSAYEEKNLFCHSLRIKHMGKGHTLFLINSLVYRKAKGARAFKLIFHL